MARIVASHVPHAQVGPEAALPGSDRAAAAALRRARELEIRGGAAAVVGAAPGSAPSRRPSGGARAIGARRGPNSLLSGIGAKIGYSSSVYVPGVAACSCAAPANVASPLLHGLLGLARAEERLARLHRLAGPLLPALTMLFPATKGIGPRKHRTSSQLGGVLASPCAVPRVPFRRPRTDLAMLCCVTQLAGLCRARRV